MSREFPGAAFDRWLHTEPEPEDLGPTFDPMEDDGFEHLCRICGAHVELHNEFGYCEQY